MANAKKILTLFPIIFLILSNFAIAQPDKTVSNAKSAMEGYLHGEISHEEMIAMAKAKLGGKFDEMQFQKELMELKERVERKDAFSYENKGYGAAYSGGPSYEGYSKEQMIFGMLYEYIGDDVDPREIKQYCNDPEKVADITINKLKEKAGDLQKVCGRIEERESKCEEYSKKSCSQLGTAFVREDANEMEKLNAIAYSCPVNKDAIKEACKRRSKLYMEQRLQNLDNSCRDRFDFEGERLLKECQRFKENQICDKETYIKKCMGGIKKEDFGKDENRDTGAKGFLNARWECYDGTTGAQNDISCKSHEYWNSLARKSCEGHCSKESGKCGVNSFSISGECRSGTSNSECPPIELLKCADGTRLQTRTDANGCAYYFCESTTTNVCTQDVQQCPDGSYVKRIPPGCNFEKCPTVACSKLVCDGVYDTGKRDANGCIIYACPTQTCPTPQIPTCGAGSTLEKRTDDKGCAYYYCATAPCPQVTKPFCNTDENLEAYYDTKGCVTSYQCIKYSTCPSVAKPTCSEGQSLTTKYDDKRCVVAYECVTVARANEISSAGVGSGPITGSVVGTTYDEHLKYCESSWMQQEKMCSETPQGCDKDDFIERCKEQEKKNYEEHLLRIEQQCASSIDSEIKHAEQRCSRMEEDRQRCMEQSSKRCSQMKGAAEECKTFMAEANLRKFMLEEARKKCKFTDIVEDEEDLKKADKAEVILAALNTATEDDISKLKLFVDNLKEELKLQDTTVYKGTIDPNRFGDIKLLPFVVNAKLSTSVSSEKSKEAKTRIVAGQKAEEAAGKLASLRDSNIPNEYLYIIEDKASEVLDVSDNLQEIEKKQEEKGVGYKIKLFLGLAKKSEEVEIRQLQESNEKLKNSIETLAKLIDEVPSDVAKAILKEQVENLKKQQEEIDSLIQTKEKKAKGWFGVFG